MIKRILAAFALLLTISSVSMAADSPTPADSSLFGGQVGVFTSLNYHPGRDVGALGGGVKIGFLGIDGYADAFGRGPGHRAKGYGFDGRLYLGELIGGRMPAIYAEIGGYHEGRPVDAGFVGDALGKGGWELTGGFGFSGRIPLPRGSWADSVQIETGWHTRKGLTLGVGINF